jgi:hypothetical protein
MITFSQPTFPTEVILKYPSIGHLPNSRMGSGDRHCNPSQTKIATQLKRDKHDRIIVTEKLDGSNVGVLLFDGILHPITRTGNLAINSFEQHQKFAHWVFTSQDRFLSVLSNGDCLRGEWLLQAHGTRYNLSHEPFVAFDLFKGQQRLVYDEFLNSVKKSNFVTPTVLNDDGEPMSVEKALGKIGTYGFHGAINPVEGAVWRVERNRPTGVKGEKEWIVDFLVKYVRPDKIDGSYLPFISGGQPVWNLTLERHSHPIA